LWRFKVSDGGGIDRRIRRKRGRRWRITRPSFGFVRKARVFRHSVQPSAGEASPLSCRQDSLIRKQCLF